MWPPRGEKRKRSPATAEATNNTQGARNGRRRIGNDESAIPPGINRVAETQPVRAPLKTTLFGDNLMGFLGRGHATVSWRTPLMMIGESIIG